MSRFVEDEVLCERVLNKAIYVKLIFKKKNIDYTVSAMEFYW